MLTNSEKNILIENHINFADRIAISQFKKTPLCVQLDDLKSAAYLGLVDAANKYDGSKPFETYASFRIFGEIKVYLRDLGWGKRGDTASFDSLDESFDCVEESDEDFEDFFQFITDGLSPVNKRILRLYYLEEKTLKEIGSEIQCSASSVFAIVKKSLKFMRNNLEREFC